VSSDRPLWLVVAALGVSVLALAIRHEQGTIAGIELNSFAALVTGVVLIFMVFGAVSALLYHRLGQTLRAGVFWLSIAGLAVAGYNYRFEIESSGTRVLAGLFPGIPFAKLGSGRAVEIARAHQGDFNIRGEVNGTRVAMLVDTGASSVVLTAEAAKAAGLPVELLKFDVPIETANGRGKAASVVLDKIAVGNIQERRVPALVTAPGDLKTSLLGMSFLSRLESFEVRGERLVMHAKSASRN
jgi:aspartyl protease family protein